METRLFISNLYHKQQHILGNTDSSIVPYPRQGDVITSYQIFLAPIRSYKLMQLFHLHFNSRGSFT